MSLLDQPLRIFIMGLMRITGLMRLLQASNRSAVTILMIHGVMNTEAPAAWRPLRPQLPRSELLAGLRLLSRYYRFVSLADAVEMLSGRAPFKPRGLVLTFDDGYRNQLQNALPVLKKFDAPGTFFLATGHIEQRRPFWFDRLDYAIQHGSLAGRKFGSPGGEIFQVLSESRESLSAFYRKLRTSAKRSRMPGSEFSLAMEQLAERLESESGRRLADVFENDDWSALMSWPEIAAQSSHPLVTFGSHTIDHIRLGWADERAASYQIAESKKMIEKHTGRECRFFCYPYGCFRPALFSVLQGCGYTAAVTTVAGLNRRGENLLALRRINVPSSGGPLELLWQIYRLSGRRSVFGWQPKRANLPEHLWAE